MREFKHNRLIATLLLSTVFLAVTYSFTGGLSSFPLAHTQIYPPESEVAGTTAVALVAGCNPTTSTYPDATPAQTLAGAVSPEDALVSLWGFELASGNWLAYAPEFPEVSDMQTCNFLDVVFICVSDPATFARPSV